VLKTMGDEVMVLFPTADAAANGASEMHAAVDTLPPVYGTKLGVRIGFHSGPVIQRDNDVFGDTVEPRRAPRRPGAEGQIVTSGETVQQLSRRCARPRAGCTRSRSRARPTGATCARSSGAR